MVTPHLPCRHTLRPASVLCMLAACGLVGCYAGQVRQQAGQLKALEERVQALEISLEPLALRSDSVAVGLEKLSERVNAVLPPTAQWLSLERGAAIKWYVDEEIQNIYVQFLGFIPETSSLIVTVTTRTEPQKYALRVGEGLEYRWTADREAVDRAEKSSPARTFVIVLHHLLRLEDGSLQAQLSLQEPKSLLPAPQP